MQHRWVTNELIVLTFALGIAGMGHVQQQFLPDSSRREILVDLWRPEGSTIQQTDAMAQRFEARMREETGVSGVTTWIGSGVPCFHLPLDQIFTQSNVAQPIVLPKDLRGPEALRVRLPAILASESFEARGRVKLLPNGSPVPHLVQFHVIGTDATAVREWTDRAKDVLLANPSMRSLNDNWNEPVKVWRLEVDQDKAGALGETSQAPGRSRRARSASTAKATS